ncbi:MAG: Flp pilus assembly complex ATPase component TadA [Gemmatimonadetes bacterium]|nr:Flp pilus assembly complex ATPase component TadA [Gemmatimonadota bacterium]
MSRDWLIQAVKRVGLESRKDAPDLEGLTAADAWQVVCKAYGITPDALASHVAGLFGLQVADLHQFEATALKRVPERFARRHDVFPLREREGTLVVATCDPTDVGIEQSLAFAAGLPPDYEVAPPDAIRAAIKSAYTSGSSTNRMLETLLRSVDRQTVHAVRVLKEMEPEEIKVREVEETPVVKLANLILLEAVTRRASDIHIGPGPGGGVVRFRIDGVLQDYMNLPLPALNRVVSRIKILGNLDITDRLRPQDGRTRIQVNDEAYDLRISTVPTRDSENAVIRILDPKGSMRFKELDMPGPELDRFRELLSYRNGIVIVTGPTGSGKTTTLYAGIREIATGDVNVMTVEDPVEYELPGVTQIQVEPERDVTFASALRAILRQDPDVIFVGEIRDLETADVAVQASTTGHLVLATLHTNSAVGIVSRLAELGLDLFSIESSLRGALAQRLLRRVCPHCVEELDDEDRLTPEEEHLVARYGTRPKVRAVGCDRCVDTGFFGRIPVAEAFLMDYRMSALVSRGASTSELERAALAGGMRSMLRCAVDRVKAGETTLQEVARVLGQTSSEDGEAVEAVEAMEAMEAPAAPAAAPAEPGAPRILVVDDDPQTRRFVRALLEHHDFVVSEAKDGREALQTIKDAAVPYSLVLLDLNMPRLGGQEVLAVLRGSEPGSSIPVVVLTASNGKSEIAALEGGADDYVPKPIVPDRLVARVRATLRRAEAYRAG